jgi:adenine C2-methylase RlmN of 23S rRNA A2503 and tRNA A37
MVGIQNEMAGTYQTQIIKWLTHKKVANTRKMGDIQKWL